MDVLKAQFAKIQEQLAGLTATQRMLAGALVAIMVMTAVLWGRYASSSESVPVIDSPFDATELVEAQNTLKAAGIAATVSGDRLVVPVDQKDQAFATLSYNKQLPANTRSAFEDVLKQTTPFDANEKSQMIFNEAREAQLAQVICTFPGVATAQVVINSTFERHIGSQPVMPSGTVVIQTRGSGADNVNHLVDSAAYTLIRTVAMMDANHVSVIVNGMTHRPHDLDGGGIGGMGGTDMYDLIDRQERRLKENIADAVRNYSNSIVSVHVALDTESLEETNTAYNPKTSMQQTLSEENTTDNTSQANAGSEPGVAPNTGMSVNAAPSSPANSTNSEKTKTAYENRFGMTQQKRLHPAGQATVESASVNLPRSDFLKRYNDANPNAKDPDEKTLEEWAHYELDNVRKRVESACGAKPGDERIVVGIYLDSPSQIAIAGTGSTATASAGISVAGHAKEIAIGVLALMSLFMVSMIVRKGSPVPAGVSLAGVGGGGLSGALGGLLDARSASAFGGDDDLTVVGGGRPAMDGVELDADSYKAQQMVEQVTSMVQENPEAAASLVKRWLNK